MPQKNNSRGNGEKYTQLKFNGLLKKAKNPFHLRKAILTKKLETKIRQNKASIEAIEEQIRINKSSMGSIELREYHEDLHEAKRKVQMLQQRLEKVINAK